MYIMQSVSRHVLYVGFCRDLVNRVWEHKTHALAGFTDEYDVTRLVYFEEYRLAPNAIAREKQVKRWRREKKEKLIASKNAKWVDLAAGWFTDEEINRAIRENQNKRSLDSAAKAAPLGMTPSREASKRFCSESQHQNQNKRSLDSAAKAAPLGMTPSREEQKATNRGRARGGQ
jgi:putative endonuclease